MPWDPRRQHEEEEERAAASARLEPLLQAFLKDPSDHLLRRHWFSAIAKECPLWTLQQQHYGQYEGDRRYFLLRDILWRRMVRAAEDAEALSAVEGCGVRWKRPVDLLLSRKTPTGEQLVHGPRRWPEDSRSFAPRFLVQSYLSELRTDIEPEPVSHHPHAVEPSGLPEEAEEALAFVDDLVPLLIERDVVPLGLDQEEMKEVRQRASERIKKYLQDTGVLLKQGGKATIPNAKEAIQALAGECRVLLGVEQSCRGCGPTADAEAKLAVWGCNDSPNWWAARLAFPFLSEHEHQWIQLNDDHRLVAVFLIDCRVAPILSLRTVADLAFSEDFMATYRERLRQGNPFCPPEG